MNWKAIAADTTRDSLESLETLLWDQGAVSVTVTDAGDNPLYEPGPGQVPVWKKVTVTGLFEDDVDSDHIRDQLGVEGFDAIHVEDLGDRIWEREWLDKFKPMQFGQNLWICPGGQEVEAHDAVVINLDPGLAFGTGTHPTTRLCLEWLDTQVLAGKCVIDYGCGSGILGIAALLLGADRVIGVDNDSQAITASRENALRNGVADRFEAGLPEEIHIEDGSADIVVANILANPLRQLSQKLIAMLNVRGHLVMSGIMSHQKSWVKESYQQYILFQEDRELDDWICLAGEKQNPL
ncbi:MAG: 50S ribosomal protein L11 methyltransferase [Pseudomonadales bacterium]